LITGTAGPDQHRHHRTFRSCVVGAILNSGEYFGLEITADYNALLGRDPDPTGMLDYLRTLQGGATPQEVRASLLGSDEFFSRVGGDSQSFLNALYGEELGRAVDPAGLADWAPLTGNAAGRTAVALAVESSPEATQLEVARIYQDTLGRAVDPAGLAFWAGQLQQGQSESAVLAGVLGSGEFFSRMQSYTTQLNTVDPNVAAETFIAQGHLFVSRLAVVPAGPTVSDSGGVPADDNNSGGDVLGVDNSASIPVAVNNPIPDNSVSGNTYDGSSSVDNSITDSTDSGGSSDCCCTSSDTSADPTDTGVPDDSSDG
jgi:hypothetical protein